MSQSRWLNFGADGDATRVKQMHQRMFGDAILSGGEITVGGTDYLSIAPWNVIFDSGIIISEDTTTTLSVTTGSAAQNYTVVLIHEDQNIVGGTSATMKLQTGIKTSVSNGVIFGWIVYPGGGAALAASMIYNVRSKTKVVGEARRQNFDAPYYLMTANNHTSRGLQILVSHASIAWSYGIHSTLGRFYTKFANGAGSDQTVMVFAQFRVTDPVPRVFEIMCSKEASPATLTSAELYDGDNNEITDVDTLTIDDATAGTRTFRLRALNVSTMVVGEFLRFQSTINILDATDLYMFEVRATSLEEPAT